MRHIFLIKNVSSKIDLNLFTVELINVSQHNTHINYSLNSRIVLRLTSMSFPSVFLFLIKNKIEQYDVTHVLFLHLFVHDDRMRHLFLKMIHVICTLTFTLCMFI